jgi:putative flippase GtrA
MQYPEGRFLRFLVSGAANTVVTYALFVVLSRFLHHMVAYTIVYAIGIVISYLLSARWVFRTSASWRTAAGFPFIYAVQYLCGIALLYAFVDVLGWRPEVAMAIVLVAGIFITYSLMRWLFAAAG